MRRLRQASLVGVAAITALIACRPDARDLAVTRERAELVATCGSSGVIRFSFAAGDFLPNQQPVVLDEVIAFSYGTLNSNGRIVLVGLDGTIRGDVPNPWSGSIGWGETIAVHATSFIAGAMKPAIGSRRLYSIDKSGVATLLTTTGVDYGPKMLESDRVTLYEGLQRPGQNGVALWRPVGTEIGFFENPDGGGFGFSGAVFGSSLVVRGGNQLQTAYVFLDTAGTFSKIVISEERIERVEAGADWLALMGFDFGAPFTHLYGGDLQQAGSVGPPLGELYVGQSLAESPHGIVAGGFTSSVSGPASVYVFDRSAAPLFRVVDPEPGRGAFFGAGIAAAGDRIIVGRKKLNGDLQQDYDVYVFPPNAPPGLAQASLVVQEDSSGSVTIPEDPDGDFVRVAILLTAAHGTVTTAGVYAPAADFSGQDSFTLGVSDGCFQTLQRVSVTVVPVPTPTPTATPTPIPTPTAVPTPREGGVPDLHGAPPASGCSCSVETRGTSSLGLLWLLAIAVTLGRRGVAAADDSA